MGQTRRWCVGHDGAHGVLDGALGMTRAVQTFQQRLTNWACQPTLYQSSDAASMARISLVDTFACMSIGTGERQSAVMSQALEASGDEGRVHPMGGGRACSLYGAAMLNGTRSHAIDFDDYEIPGSTHVSAPIFSALLALAQLHDVSIRQVTDAWVVGFEAIVRIGTALGYGHYEKGWHATATLGPIGVAAACSRLLGADPAQMAHAMALATSSSAGMKSQFGFDAKALHVGMAAEAGLRAAMLAQVGATGNIDIWDAPQGLMEMYGTPSSMGFDAMTETMREGEATAAFPVARKFWPSCSYTHRVISCAVTLAPEVSDVAAIKRIRLRMPEPFHRVSRFGAPTTSNEARFSAVYCAVVGLLKGQVLPEDFTIETFSDPVRQHLCGLVELDLYDLPAVPPDQLLVMTPERVTVELATGQLLEHETHQVPGSAERPMTSDDVLDKLAACGGSRERGQAFMVASDHTALAECALFSAH